MDFELSNINFNEINHLESRFVSSEISWLERDFKTENHVKLQDVSDDLAYFTRSRRRSSIRVNLAKLLGLIKLTRIRDVAFLRTKLALLETTERRSFSNKESDVSVKEIRKLLGSTRITNERILDIKQNGICRFRMEELESIGAQLHQRNLSRNVWVPRRLIRYLAANGSRIEIGVALLLCVRRRYYRLQRSRLGTRLASTILKCGRQYVRAALLKLQEKKILLKHQGAWWATKRYGTQFEIATDMGLPTPSNINRRIRNYRKLEKEKNAKRYPLLNIDPRYKYLEQLLLIYPAAAAADDNVSGFIEYQDRCGRLLSPDDPDVKVEKPAFKRKEPFIPCQKPTPAPKRHEEPRLRDWAPPKVDDEARRLEIAAAARRKFLQDQIDALKPKRVEQPPLQQEVWVPKTTEQCDERRAFLKRQAEEFMKMLEEGR